MSEIRIEGNRGTGMLEKKQMEIIKINIRACGVDEVMVMQRKKRRKEIRRTNPIYVG